MAQKALVKLDDTVKTGSTGGVVIAVEKIYPEYLLSNAHIYFSNFEMQDNYKIFTVNDKVCVGWIYTDKTNFFVDSNVSNNV